jgi:hypothetical protein
MEYYCNFIYQPPAPIAYASESGMDIFFKKRVLFERFGDRYCWVVTESEDQRKNR